MMKVVHNKAQTSCRLRIFATWASSGVRMRLFSQIPIDTVDPKLKEMEPMWLK